MQRGARSRLVRCRTTALACALAFAAGPAYAAGVVPDGGTATSVSTASNGRQTVTLAPATYGVSQNTYTSFNVGKPGVTLENNGVNARTIVNTVTSTNPSLIQGDITVDGPRANVVLANPNGITVDGGSFVNTGHVALTTGQVSFADVALGGGQFDRTVQITTQGGAITIGPGGLSGTLIGLELIAKSIQINGPVTNQFTSSTGYVRAIAGNSQVTLNTAFSADDNSNDWLTLANAATNNPNAIALDLEAPGSITAGRIQLITTDLGAGVRSAGALVASAGDFTLTTAGDVQLLSGSSVTAAGNATLTASGAVSLAGASFTANAGAAQISGSSFTAENAGSAKSTVASGSSGVLITTTGGDLDVIGSLIQGETRIAGNVNSFGAVTLTAQGNLTNRYDPTTGVGSAIYGVDDDVTITAASITNRNASIESGHNVTLTATDGDIDNLIDATPGANGGVPVGYATASPHWLFFSRSDTGLSVDYGTLAAPSLPAQIEADSNESTLAGSNAYDVTLTGRNIDNVGGSILANGLGNVTLNAQQQLLDQAVFSGQASYSKSCFVFCHGSASSTVQANGGVIEAGGAVTLTANTQATNIGGTVYAQNGDVTVTAPTIVAEGVLGYTAYDRNRGLKAWFGNTWATLYAADDGGLFEAASGKVTLVGQGLIEGGSFSGAQGVSGKVVTVSSPLKQPVTLGNHLGLVSWLGL